MTFNMQHGDENLVEGRKINVTPFIEVVLVLLIVFMVAATPATVNANVDVPASTAQPQPRPDRPIFLTVKADHTLAISDNLIGRDELPGALDRLSNGDKTARVFLRGGMTVDYAMLMQIMNDLRTAGYLKIAIVGLD